MVIQITREMASKVKSGQDILLARGSMVPPPTIDTVMPIGTESMTKDIGLTIDGKDITGTARILQVITENMLYSLTPEYTRLSNKCDCECSVASDFKEHLDVEDVPTPDSRKD